MIKKILSTAGNAAGAITPLKYVEGGDKIQVQIDNPNGTATVTITGRLDPSMSMQTLFSGTTEGVQELPRVSEIQATTSGNANADQIDVAVRTA